MRGAFAGAESRVKPILFSRKLISVYRQQIYYVLEIFIQRNKAIFKFNITGASLQDLCHTIIIKMASFDIDVKENEIGYICKVSGPRKF